MKKLFYILSVALLATGCNFLDFDESSSDYSRDDMYLTYSNIQKMLTNIYGYMPNKNIYDVSDALRDCGSDDAEYGDPDASVQRFTNGTWSALNTVDDKWSTMYSGIRSANEFLESIKTVDLSMYQYDTKYQRWLEHLKYYPYQAKVLRAYYFFELARRYGDIPMPLTMLTAEEIWEECICDSLGDMNIFGYDKEAAELMKEAIPDIQKAVKETAKAPTKQKNTADGGGKYSLNVNAKTELHKALYDKGYDGEVLLRDESPAIMVSQSGVRNLPMSMKLSHIRENVFTKEEAKKTRIASRRAYTLSRTRRGFFLKGD